MTSFAFIPVIADALPNPQSHEAIGWWIVAGAAVLGIINSVGAAVRQIAGKGERRELANDPLRVEITRQFATHTEMQEVKEAIRVIQHRLDQLPKELGDSSEDRMNRVHERIDLLQQKITDMPGQIVTLLRNAGRIG